MKYLLVALNASYIHSNLGVYLITAYVRKHDPDIDIQYAEYTINHNTDEILRDVYSHNADAIGFSCYIWNIDVMLDLIRDMKQLRPDMPVIVGGPEVSYRAEDIMKEIPEIDIVMRGEGEESTLHLLHWLDRKMRHFQSEKPVGFIEGREAIEDGGDNTTNEYELADIGGITYRDGDRILSTPDNKLMNLDDVVFPYPDVAGEPDKNRIIYYESSRGCPFRCSYCLSSIDKQFRERSLELVLPELQYFLDRDVKQVKFIDRTANADKKHITAIWKYLIAHDNGITNFHFETEAEILDDDEIELISYMRPGLIQLEIGVQTANPDTLREIRRPSDIGSIGEKVARIHAFHNAHIHLDLIAGLPYEDLVSFRKSFDVVYGMQPDQLQLGFLKVLSGSHMADMCIDYDLKYTSRPPYEVLHTKWLLFEDIIELKKVEAMVGNYYNTRQFDTTLALLHKEYGSAYELFRELGDFYSAHSYDQAKHNRIDRYNILYEFIADKAGIATDGLLSAEVTNDSIPDVYYDALIRDVYLRENIKKRPAWADDLSQYSKEISEIIRNADLRTSECHVEIYRDGTCEIFDYSRRDPLTDNAITYKKTVCP